MKLILLATLSMIVALNSSVLRAAEEPVSSSPGYVMGGEFTKARDIIAKKCTPCHSTANIDAALKSGKDMGSIQNRMEKRGAQLTADERDVLGIYWTRNPLKK